MAASPPRKSHSESLVGQTRGPALGTGPACGQWGFRHHGTSRRQSPTSAHARCRAGNGKEWGRTCCPLAGGHTAPHDPRRPQGRPIVCSGSMRACENGGPPPLPFREGRAKRDSNPGCNYPVRGYSPSMHFFWGGDMPRYSPPLPFRRGRAGRGRWPAHSGPSLARGSQTYVLAACPGPGRGRVRARWPVGVADVCAMRRAQARTPGHGHVRARGSRTGEARARMGGEGECARTGDSNPGCNYPVRGYSPSMHFFWGGARPVILLPPFSAGQSARARACWPAHAGARRRVRGHTRWLARPCPRLSARPRTPLAATAPRFSPVCAPILAEFFNFLTDISV